MSKIDVMGFHNLFGHLWWWNSECVNFTKLKAHERLVLLGQATQGLVRKRANKLMHVSNRGSFHGPGGSFLVEMLALDLSPILYSMYRKRRKAKRIEEKRKSMSKRRKKVAVKIKCDGFLSRDAFYLSPLSTFKNKSLWLPTSLWLSSYGWRWRLCLFMVLHMREVIDSDFQLFNS